jgi:hypothetical protein
MANPFWYILCSYALWLYVTKWLHNFCESRWAIWKDFVELFCNRSLFAKREAAVARTRITRGRFYVKVRNLERFINRLILRHCQTVFLSKNLCNEASQAKHECCFHIPTCLPLSWITCFAIKISSFRSQWSTDKKFCTSYVAISNSRFPNAKFSTVTWPNFKSSNGQIFELANCRSKLFEIITLRIWSVEQMTFRKYVFCRNFDILQLCTRYLQRWRCCTQVVGFGLPGYVHVLRIIW